jgi:mono/diheme cytochrome c family protein
MLSSLILRTGILLSAALFSTTALMTQQSQTTLKHGPITSTSPASGEQMFNAYCAVCHGKDGKGGGPAAVALKTPPPDLSTLDQRHGGKYPAAYVESVLRWGAESFPAHGSKDMPMWGPAFASLSGGSTGSTTAPEVTMRINNLTHYIETLQAK